MRRAPHDWEFHSDRPVIGVDEVGVGPIAGPMHACAVMLKPGITGADLPAVRDSKKMSRRAREDCLESILDKSIHWICRSTRDTDRPGARLALLAECASAVKAVWVGAPPVVVVDGNLPVPGIFDQVCLVRGDDRCLEVACASVVAKVLRDRLMSTLDAEFPVYGWIRGMGYPTEEHLEALETHGPCGHHRRGPTENAMRTWRNKRGKS